MEVRNICPICLRTDRKLKSIATELSVYHDELTDYCLEISKPRYCSECEYLLRKTYNFHRKCSKAAKILNKWAKNKVPINQLHLKLPPINLKICTPKNNTVFTYICPEELETSVPADSISEKPYTNITNDNNITDKLDVDGIKQETIESTSHNENLFKIEVHCDNYQVTEVSETVFQHFNAESDDIILSNLVNDRNKTKVDNKRNSIEETRNITSNSKNKNQNKSKKQKNIELVLDVNDTVKGSDRNEVVIEKSANRDMIKTSNSISQSMLDSNNKTIEPRDLDVEVILCDDDDSKNNDVIEIDDEMDYPDDASLNSDDDCDDYLYTPPKKRKIKMTLDELADITLSGDDLDDEYLAENESKSKKHCFDINAAEKRIVYKLFTMSKTLDSICENWEISSLIDVGIPNVPNDEIKKFTCQFFSERKGSDNINAATSKFLKKRSFDAKLAHLRGDLDTVTEKCVRIVEDYKNGLNDPKLRLKAELMQKFDSWGELKAEDGFVFDKDIIINCLDMVNERLIRQLINLLHGANTLTPGAAVILKRIQNKQNENQYESIFNIEYLTTEKEMLDEFQRRKTYECYVEAKFKCEVCYQGFKHERLLDYHKKCHDESNGSISCTICHVRHHSRRRLKKHMSAHVAVYKCKLCPLVTYYRLSMINHYEQHNGTLYKCEPCGGTYKSKSAFLSHQTHMHPSGAHVCTSCGRGFISPLGLRTHVTRKHRGETAAVAAGGGERCAACGLTFPSQEAYVRHDRTLHGAPPVYKKKRAPRFLKPRKKPNMTCTVCNTVGHSYGWLTHHFSTEHPTVDMAAAYADKRTYLCDVCGKGFSHKYTLREHIGYHTGVTFPCPTCSKRFLSTAALRRHRLTHAPPGFCCERCGKKFHSYPNLYNHMRSHIGDRRFKCNICSKGFLHRCSLKEHIRGVHNHERRVRKRGVEPQGVAETHGVSDTGILGVDASHGVANMGVKGVLETGGDMG